MKKYRKAYFEIEKALGLDVYGVIILFGLRKTGKTTILKQLAEKHSGYYLDFRESKDAENDYLNIYKRSEKLILLDEIGYLQSYDAYFSNLEADIKSAGKKVVITSSSYGTLKQLELERLGGGRSHPVQLFPLSFEEYLYFSGKIPDYGTDYTPDDQDLQDFYRLRHLPPGMDFIINREYLRGVFNDIEVAHDNAEYAVRDVFLDKSLYTSVADIIAYTLNDQISMKRFSGKLQVGAQELGRGVTGLPISESLISLANNILKKAFDEVFPDITIKDLAQIVLYLFHNGFLFVDLMRNEDGAQSTSRIEHRLSLVRTFADLEQIFTTYVFSVISPLLYTRLMIDLEEIAGRLCAGAVYGRLFELTVKSENVFKMGYDTEYYSYKYRLGSTEVDLWHKNLLLEASVRHKRNDECSVDKVALNYRVIRVLTDEARRFDFNGNFYRIGYPRALLMISNDEIFSLNATEIAGEPGAAGQPLS